jgi:hypothetical protein
VSDETDDEFQKMVYGEFAAGIEQLCAQLGYLDARLVQALTDQNPEDIQQVGMEINNLMIQIPWGTMPTLIMAVIRQLNVERSENIDSVQQWYLEARVLEDALKLLAGIEQVPAFLLSHLSNVRGRMDSIVSESRYADTVERS